MLVCPKCGQKNREDRSVCFQCGAALAGGEPVPVTPCPACGQPNWSQDAICSECRGKLARADRPRDEAEVQAEPVVSMGEWVVTMLLTAIPLIGSIIVLLWSFNSESESKRNWAKASLLFWCIGLVIALARCTVVLR